MEEAEGIMQRTLGGLVAFLESIIDQYPVSEEQRRHVNEGLEEAVSRWQCETWPALRTWLGELDDASQFVYFLAEKIPEFSTFVPFLERSMVDHAPFWNRFFENVRECQMLIKC